MCEGALGGGGCFCEDVGLEGAGAAWGERGEVGGVGGSVRELA